MGRSAIITVDMEKPIHKEVSDTKPEDISLRQFVNNVLLMNVEKHKLLKLVAPKFSVIEVTQDSILIKDETVKKTRFAQIIIKNEKLWCDLDESGDCTHIRYSLMLPELVKLKGKLKQI